MTFHVKRAVALAAWTLDLAFALLKHAVRSPRASEEYMDVVAAHTLHADRDHEWAGR